MIINNKTIANPEWGNIVRSAKSKPIIHTARNSSRRSHIKRIDSQVFKFTVRYTSYDDIIDLFDTLKFSMHQEKTLINWDGQIWVLTRCLTNPFELVNVLKSCNGYGSEIYEFTLEFEGNHL